MKQHFGEGEANEEREPMVICKIVQLILNYTFYHALLQLLWRGLYVTGRQSDAFYTAAQKPLRFIFAAILSDLPLDHSVCSEFFRLIEVLDKCYGFKTTNSSPPGVFVGGMEIYTLWMTRIHWKVYGEQTKMKTLQDINRKSKGKDKHLARVKKDALKS